MKHPLLLFILATTCATLSLLAADPAANTPGNIQSLHIIPQGTGWFLIIQLDGSGSLQYGAGGADNTRFPAGSFDFRELCEKLKSISVPNRTRPGNDDGQVMVYMHSNPDIPHTYIQDKDKPYILQLFQQAVAKGRSHDSERFDWLMKNHPFLPSK